MISMIRVDKGSRVLAPQKRLTLNIVIVAIGFFSLSGPRLIVADDFLRQIIVISVLSIILITRQATAPRVPRNLSFAPLVLFAIFCLLSSFWSSNPGLTLSAAFLTLASIMFGRIAARVLPVHAILSAIVLAATAASILSILLSIFAPSEALVAGQYQYGSLVGIYTHRNLLAFVVTIGLIAAMTLVFFTAEKRAACLIAICVLAFTLWRTASAAAELVFVISVLLILLQRILVASQSRYRILILLFLASVVTPALLFVTVGFRDLIALLGRDESLTGRTEIWAAVFEQFRNSPWVGVGWSATWTDTSDAQLWVSEATGFRVFHAHNAFLDVALQVGLVGLGLLLISLFMVMIPPARLFFKHFSAIPAGALTFGTLFVLTAYSFVEPGLSGNFGLAFVAFLSGSVVPLTRSPPPPEGVVQESNRG